MQPDDPAKTEKSEPEKIQIDIDTETRQILIGLGNAMNEIQQKMQLILQVYLNAKGYQGKPFNLSPDYSTLTSVNS